MPGSFFSHGDQAFQRLKSLMSGKIFSGGAWIVAVRCTWKVSGRVAANSSTAATSNDNDYGDDLEHRFLRKMLGAVRGVGWVEALAPKPNDRADIVGVRCAHPNLPGAELNKSLSS